MPPSETQSGPDAKPFQCRICKNSFSKNEHLARHIRSHRKEKPFICPDCGNRYSRQDILLRHRRDVRCRPSTNEKPANIAAVNELNPDVASVSLTPPYNPCTWIEPPPTDIGGSLLIGDTLFQNDRFQLGSSDLNGFNTAQHIDAELREEISARDFSSFEHSQFFRSSPLEYPSLENCHLRNVQKLWFTTITEIPTQNATIEKRDENPSQLLSPESSNRTINEGHRQSMSDRLLILTYEPTVPSTDLLNVGLHLYFTKVHPLFPLVHAATFQPCRKNADLVVAMCAIGGLFTGSDQSLEQGIYLFQRVHKATLHNWEQLLARGNEELTVAIQGAAISQLFGLLSGSANLLLTVDAFHGPPIAWARYLRLYSSQSVNHVDPTIDGEELKNLWLDWARNEEIIRVAHGLFIMDAELGALLHHEPIQSWKAYKLPFCCSERAFAASNARDWKEIYCGELEQLSSISEPSSFPTASPRSNLSSCVPAFSSLTAYATMESISSDVLQSTYQSRMTMLDTVHESLADLNHHLLPYCSPGYHGKTANDVLQLCALQNLIYMEALADFDLMERAVGRDGIKLTIEEAATVTAWANSAHALRCVMHALLIKRHVEAMSIMSEPALHVPRAMFWAGLVLFCYLRFGTSDAQNLFNLVNPVNVEFREFFWMNIDVKTLHSDFGTSSLKITFFSLIDILQQTGHWRITKRFAAILSALGRFAFGQAL